MTATLRANRISISIVFLIWSLLAEPCGAVVTYSESRGASERIGRWLLRSTSHYDFASATPVGPLRSGRKFFVKEAPLQMASDYGASSTRAAIPGGVRDAYDLFGIPTTELGTTWTVKRVHAIWSFANRHDFSYSMLFTPGISAWGIGYKYVIDQFGPIYYSYRVGVSHTERPNWFKGEELANELSISAYFTFIDIFAGVRHTMGQGEFDSSVSALSLPQFDYIGRLKELEYFFGVVLATTTNTRLALQLGAVGGETLFAAKFSFRFDDLYPKYQDWFRDPRRINR